MNEIEQLRKELNEIRERLAILENSANKKEKLDKYPNISGLPMDEQIKEIYKTL